MIGDAVIKHDNEIRKQTRQDSRNAVRKALESEGINPEIIEKAVNAIQNPY